MRISTGDNRTAAFDRLSQRLERRAHELRQFIEKQHAIMGQRNLTRTRADAAADQRR